MLRVSDSNPQYRIKTFYKTCDNLCLIHPHGSKWRSIEDTVYKKTNVCICILGLLRPEDEPDVAGTFYRLPTLGHNPSHKMTTDSQQEMSAE